MEVKIHHLDFQLMPNEIYLDFLYILASILIIEYNIELIMPLTFCIKLISYFRVSINVCTRKVNKLPSSLCIY